MLINTDNRSVARIWLIVMSQPTTAYEVDTCEWDSSDGEQYWLPDVDSVTAFLSKPRRFKTSKRTKLLETFPELHNDYSNLEGVDIGVSQPQDSTPPAHLDYTAVPTEEMSQQPTSQARVKYTSLQPHQTLDDVDTQEDDIDDEAQPSRPTVMVLYGLTGAGKSTFCHHLVALDPSYVRINQDVLKTRQACLAKAAATLQNGHNVVIDRTNLTPKQRAYWLDLAHVHHARAIAVHLVTPKNTCMSRAQRRVNHEGGVEGQDAKRIIGLQASDPARCPPTKAEGFAEVFAVTSTVSCVKAVLAGKHVSKAQLSQPAGQRAITSFFRQPSQSQPRSSIKPTQPTLASLSSAPAWGRPVTHAATSTSVASSSPDSFPSLNNSYRPRITAPEFKPTEQLPIPPAPLAPLSPLAPLAPNTPSHRYEMTVALSDQVRDTFEAAPGWSCAACTYVNTKPLALACEICGAVQPTTNHSQEIPPSLATQEEFLDHRLTQSQLSPNEASQDSVLDWNDPSRCPFCFHHDQHPKQQCPAFQAFLSKSKDTSERGSTAPAQDSTTEDMTSEDAAMQAPSLALAQADPPMPRLEAHAAVPHQSCSTSESSASVPLALATSGMSTTSISGPSSAVNARQRELCVALIPTRLDEAGQALMQAHDAIQQEFPNLTTFLHCKITDAFPVNQADVPRVAKALAQSLTRLEWDGPLQAQAARLVVSKTLVSLILRVKDARHKATQVKEALTNLNLSTGPLKQSVPIHSKRVDSMFLALSFPEDAKDAIGDAYKEALPPLPAQLELKAVLLDLEGTPQVVDIGS
eukprot:m.222789 g.222789  ORF g.222789 m.222789 type:complete len:804 (+) comp17257_c1_seq5:2122-4533(+)